MSLTLHYVLQSASGIVALPTLLCYSVAPTSIGDARGPNSLMATSHKDTSARMPECLPCPLSVTLRHMTQQSITSANKSINSRIVRSECYICVQCELVGNNEKRQFSDDIETPGVCVQISHFTIFATFVNFPYV